MERLRGYFPILRQPWLMYLWTTFVHVFWLIYCISIEHELFKKKYFTKQPNFSFIKNISFEGKYLINKLQVFVYQ